MASWFVDGTAGSDSNAGTSWSVPFQTVTKALSVASSGDIIACGSIGSYTAGAAINWSLPSGMISIVSSTNPGSGTAITPTAGASEAVGAAAAAFVINGNASGSSAYIYGMHVAAGTNNSGTSTLNVLTGNSGGGNILLDTCTLSVPTTATGGVFNVGGFPTANNFPAYIIAKNCVFSFGSRAGTGFVLQLGSVSLINPTFSFGARQPDALFGTANVRSAGIFSIKDADLSGFINALVSVASNGVTWQFENIRLNGSTTVTTGSWARGSGSITLRNTNGAEFGYYNPYGVLTSNTSVSRSGGAQFSGSGISWQIVTTSLCGPQSAFYTPPIGIWGTTTSAETPTVEITFDATSPNPTSVLTDLQIWPSIDFNGNATYPIGTYQSGRNASPIVGTGTAWNTSTQTWAGTSGFTNATKQTLNPAGNGGTITPAVAGLLNTIIGVAVPSATLYIDPYVNGVT